MICKRSLILTFAVTAGLVLIPRETTACGCGEPLGTVAYQLNKARVVFVGRVVRLELAGPRASGRDDEDMVATFTIEHRWKGPAKRTIRVRTSGNQTVLSTCGVDFQLGRRYVVFAAYDPLQTTSCWFTRAAELADDLIRELDAASKSGLPSNTRLHPSAAVSDRTGLKHSSRPPRVSRGR
jgi:hypothetical protein